MPSRERWLVEKDGRVLVQSVNPRGALGYEVPTELRVGERVFKFVSVEDGVEVYEEQE